MSQQPSLLARAQRLSILVALLCALVSCLLAVGTPALPLASRALRCAVDALVAGMLLVYFRTPMATTLPPNGKRRAIAITGRVLASAMAVASGYIVVTNSPDLWLRLYRTSLTVGFAALFAAGLTPKALLRVSPRLGLATRALVVCDAIAMAALYFTADFPGWARWVDASVIPSVLAREQNPSLRDAVMLSDGRPLEVFGDSLRVLASPGGFYPCGALALLSEAGPVRSLEAGDDYIQGVAVYSAAHLASCAEEIGSPAQIKRAAAVFMVTAKARPTEGFVSAAGCGATRLDDTLLSVVAGTAVARGVFADRLWERERARLPGLPVDRRNVRARVAWEVMCMKRAPRHAVVRRRP